MQIWAVFPILGSKQKWKKFEVRSCLLLVLRDTQENSKEIFALAEFPTKLCLELRNNIKDVNPILNKKTDSLVLLSG